MVYIVVMPSYQDSFVYKFTDWEEAQEKARGLEREGELFFIFQGKQLELKKTTQYILMEKKE